MNEWTSKQWRDRNDSVIPDFRANGGVRPGGAAPLLLLTTKGRKSGQVHTTPLNYLADGDRFCVFASKGGSPNHPAWYLNLVANPEVTIEVGGDSFVAKATAAEPAERDRLFAIQCERFPNFADYQSKTERTIPVVVIERKP